MSSRAGSGLGAIKQLWFKWKSLKLPWRRQFLRGSDLSGNTFWEFKDQMNANRFRRIVKYAKNAHYGDVKISPQWHQWLRHTRPEPPSVQEQHYDLARQAQMKELAARADERWRNQESFLDAPERQQPGPAIGVKDTGGYMPPTEPEEKQGVMSGVEDQENVQKAVEGKETDVGRFRGSTKEKPRDKGEAPWAKQQRGSPGEGWQPESWTPGAVPRR